MVDVQTGIMVTAPIFLPNLFPIRARMTPKIVLVIGANGYIGNAVACAFAKAQYITLGVVRSVKNAPALAKKGIRPVIGCASDKQAVIDAVQSQTKTLDVIVSTTEQWPDYAAHFNDTIDLVTTLATMSNSAGVRPLLIFSSGCKDYGPGELAGAAGCRAHTEATPLHPPDMLAPRTHHAPKVFEHAEVFDAVVTRPTNVHGGPSSYYGIFIELARRAKRSGTKLVLPGDPNTIAHSLHVDDCADAYVALADHPARSEVAGQIFNISPGKRYETLQQVADALTQTFRLQQKIECAPPTASETAMASALFAWSQWVGSEKIRELTGWRDTRPMFAEGMSLYKQEYEESVRQGDENVARVLARFGGALDAMVPE